MKIGIIKYILVFFLSFHSIDLYSAGKAELVKQNGLSTVFLVDLINHHCKEVSKFTEKFVLVAMVSDWFLTET